MDEFGNQMNRDEGIPGELRTFEGGHHIQYGVYQGVGHFQGDGDQQDFVMMSDSFVNDLPIAQSQEFNTGITRQGMGQPELLPGNYNYMNRLQNNADVSRDTVSDFGNMEAYRRSGPEGSPAFHQSSGFLPSIGSDNESSVIFRPVRQLDFSALDETGQTDEIVPHGMNRSVSTPEQDVRSMSYLEREVCGSQADDENTRETSPETGFFELKSSPLQTSESEGELDSRVIFSPLNNVTGGRENINNMSTSFEPNLTQGDVINNSNILIQNQSVDFMSRPQFSPPSRPFEIQGLPQQRHHMSPVPGNSVEKHAVFVNIPPGIPESDSGYGTTARFPPNNAMLNSVPNSFSGQPSPRLQSIDDISIRSIPQSQQLPVFSVAAQTFSGACSLPARLSAEVNSPPKSQGQINVVGSPKSYHQNVQNRSVENSPGQRSNQPQGQLSNSPQGQRPNPPQGLPSPSAWQIPGDDQRKQNKSLFKEPKMAAPRRVNAVQTQSNKRPTMPAKNSQREVVNPTFKARQDQTKRETSLNRSRGQGQSLDIRSGNLAGEKVQRSGPPPTAGQQVRNSRNSRPSGEDGSRKGISVNRRGNQDLPSGAVGKKSSVQTGPDYERKVEGSLHGNKSERSRTIGQVSSSDRGAGTGQDSSPNAHHPGANVVTQVQQYGQRPDGYGQRSKARMQQPPAGMDGQQADTSLDVQGMEHVRGQLQSMLRLSEDALSESHQYNHVDTVSGLLLDMPPDSYLYQAPPDQSAARGREDVSELYENFPSFTSRIWSDTSNITRSDTSLHEENHRLRDMLEKERYRRKHCEQHIQKQNVKLLETQQQVAVAVSTDKRKDIMIEQLDKQLAKVVEGWKKRDEEKEEYIRQVHQEKAQSDGNLAKQQSMIKNFEQEMSNAVTELRQEKEDAMMTIETLKTEVEGHQLAHKHLEDVLKSEHEKMELMEQECQKVRDNRELNDLKVQQLQDRLHKEQDEWFKREQELLQRIEEVTEKHMKMVLQERSKNAELESHLKEREETFHKSQTDAKRLDMDLDVVTRERESLKVEMGIMEDKYETSQRTLEAELHSQMQKEIASQIADVHKRMEEEEEQMRKNHRHQMKELGQRHGREMEKQLAHYHDDLKNREDESRKICQEYEQKLHESRTEITSLQSTKQKLESQRTEILMKLQYMMQSQWNEAVAMLAGSPKRKNPQTSNLSFLTRSESNDTVAPASSQSHDQSGMINVSAASSPAKEYVVTDQSSQSLVDHYNPVLSESGPFNPELSLADFSASLHIQQLLQSLSQPGMVVTNTSEAMCNAVLGTNATQTVGTNRQPQHNQKPPEATANTEVFRMPGNPQKPVNQEVFRMTNNPKANKEVFLMPNNPQANKEVFRMPSNPQTNKEVFRMASNPQASNNQEMFEMPHSPHTSMSHEFRIPNNSQLVLEQSHNTSHRSDLYNHSVQNWMHDTSTTSLPPSSKPGVDWSIQQANLQPIANQQQQQQPVAVPIRPPQQHGSDSQHYGETDASFRQDQQLANSMLLEPHDWHQQPSGHSPPTKLQGRSRIREEQHYMGSPDDDTVDEKSNLDLDYSQLSDRLQEHESRQGQLQHYIQMLLQKPPGVTDEDGDIDYENNSQFSLDQTEELDLNDTAQAAQLQRELTRIQQLRDKQTGGAGDKEPTQTETGGFLQGNSLQGILNPDQLAEISRLLGQQRELFEQPQAQQQDAEQITELMEVLKSLNTRQPERLVTQVQQMQGGRKLVHPIPNLSPRSPPQTSQREVGKVKRNLKVTMTAVADGGQAAGTKVAPGVQAKRVDRKVAPATAAKPCQGQGQGKSKSAWK